MNFKFIIIVLSLINPLTNAQAFVYITDKVEIPLRSEKNFEDNIIRSLSSGAELSILQVTEDGWTQVVFGDLIGWIISRYLSNNPPAKVQLEKLEKINNANNLLITKIVNRKAELELEIKELKLKNIDLSIQSNKSNAEKKHIEKIYKDALKLEHSNEKLITTNLQLKSEIQLLENNKTATEESSSRNWFITGSVVLFFGILIGFIFPNFVNRRRY
jgi:SH3 domain protein